MLYAQCSVVFFEGLDGLDIAIMLTRYVKGPLPNHRQDQESRAWLCCGFGWFCDRPKRKGGGEVGCAEAKGYVGSLEPST